jgi:group I intron endonuclease
MYTLYKHINTITGKSYIGFTSFTMEERWRQHIKLATVPFRRSKKTVKFWNAIRKYGVDCWKHEVLTMCETAEEARNMERRLIAEENTLVAGYNSTAGGDGVMKGRKHTDEAREKIRLAGIGRVFTKERRVRIAKSKEKHFVATHLDGRRTEVIGLKQWCEKMGLSRVVLGRTIHSHKPVQYGKNAGWMIHVN